MGRESLAVETRWLYTLLAIAFVMAMMSQVTFTIDSIRAWYRDYPVRPISLAAPWPTIDGTSPYANQAGLRVGDRVISIEGREPKGLKDLAEAVRAKRTGDRLRIVVSRDGRPLEFAVKLTPVLPDKEQIAVTFILMPWLSLALGFWVAAVRPRDKIAWMMLGILVGLSEIERAPLLDLLGWPAAIGIPAVAFRQLASFAWGPSMLLFGFYFPKRGRIDARVPWLKWLFAAPLLVSGIWESIRTVGFALSFDAARTIPPNPLPEWLLRVLMYSSISLFFTAIGEKYGDPSLGKDHLRRLRLLYWGCTISMTPSAVMLVYYGVVHHSNPRGPTVIWSDMALILFPITLAYVIVVQRAMDVRMVIRQGVQYALARRGVRVLQAVLTIAVLAGSANLLESTKLSGAMRYTLIAIVIVLVMRIRDAGERLRRWVDRRFFREAYNAEQLLGQLGEQVHGILERDALLETVVRRIPSRCTLSESPCCFRKAGSSGRRSRWDIRQRRWRSLRPAMRPCDNCETAASRCLRMKRRKRCWARSCFCRSRLRKSCSASSAWARSVRKSRIRRATSPAANRRGADRPGAGEQPVLGADRGGGRESRNAASRNRDCARGAAAALSAESARGARADIRGTLPAGARGRRRLLRLPRDFEWPARAGNR